MIRAIDEFIAFLAVRHITFLSYFRLTFFEIFIVFNPNREAVKFIVVYARRRGRETGWGKSVLRGKGM